MIIQAHGTSDIGQIREINEDYIVVEPELGLFVVCDGIGGHASGEVASETAAKTIRHHVSENISIVRDFDGSPKARDAVELLLRQAIQQACAEVFDLASRDLGYYGMGTTCIALIVAGDKGFMGHVGDSRMYLVRSGHVWQLSQDHTFLNDAVFNGKMSYEEARQSPWADSITRAVGTQHSVAVDTLVFDIVQNDTVLLCSDGLTAYVQEPEEISKLISAQAVEDVTTKLIRTANERGGRDNISAIVVRASSEKPAMAYDTARRIKVTQSLETLRHIVLFRDLADSELVRLFAKFKNIDRAAGETIIAEGEETYSMFVIVEGEVQVKRNGKALAKLGRGAHFGEMSLLNQRPRSASVTTTMDTQLLILERDFFNQVLREDTALAAKMLYKLAQILCIRLEESSKSEVETVTRKGFQLSDLLSPFRHNG